MKPEVPETFQVPETIRELETFGILGSQMQQRHFRDPTQSLQTLCDPTESPDFEQPRTSTAMPIALPALSMNSFSSSFICKNRYNFHNCSSNALKKIIGNSHVTGYF